MPANYTAGFGTGPDLGLELKFVSKLREAHVLRADALQSEGREGIRLKLGGRDYFCVVLSCRIMFCRSSAELVFDVPSLMQATRRNGLFQRPFGSGLSFTVFTHFSLILVRNLTCMEPLNTEKFL